MTSKEEEVLHRLDYLNLETGEYQRKRTVDKLNLVCFSKENIFKHKFHSEDLQLNTISDISYHILHNQIAISQAHDIIFKNYLNILHKQRTKTDSLIENIKIIQHMLEIEKTNKLLFKKDLAIENLGLKINKLEEKLEAINKKLDIIIG